MTHQELIERAKAVLGEFQLAEQGLTAGAVSCALMTNKGTIYRGICLDLACGIGFCAEHAAIAEMLKARETVIDYIVAVKFKENHDAMREMPRVDDTGEQRESEYKSGS